jgi:hypothetical protein
MENGIAGKRGLLVILILATVVVFIGLVWAIANYLPFNSTASPRPSDTLVPPRLAMDCVAPVAYWVGHPEYYPEQLVLAGTNYPAATIKEIFTSQASDLSSKIKAQLTAAYLNIQSGAGQSYIQATIFQAYGWLMSHPPGDELQQADQEEGMRLFNLLEAYNLGETGVAPCDVAYLTQQAETGTVTATSTVTFTSSPEPSETAPPSETPQPTETLSTSEAIPTATYEYIPPVRTATWTSAPPIQNPTKTPLPPTNPPVPTDTQRPPNTPTSRPPPTATFTLPPLPTATYTLPPPP